MSSRTSVVLNGRTYTRRGGNWMDETGTVVPAFLRPALIAALGTNADSRESLGKGSNTLPRRGTDQRVKRKRKG